MDKVIELRKVIKTLLENVHSYVYYQTAPDDAIYPYLVYDLPNSFDDGQLEVFVLDVDGWERSGNTGPLEKLMNAVNQELNKRTVNVDGAFVFSFYTDNRLSLIDDDKRLKRRKYVYQVRTYGGS